MNPLIWEITIVTLLITPLVTTHEPPSRGSGLGLGVSGFGLKGFRAQGLLELGDLLRFSVSGSGV